ncbi:hypothetical protein AN958_06455 [Leucoagaricus sp. SymC.cos]|nr:hypothetical protein AN958_06455 [Leucoagaricus sp. SymC.cos]
MSHPAAFLREKHWINRSIPRLTFLLGFTSAWMGNVQNYIAEAQLSESEVRDTFTTLLHATLEFSVDPNAAFPDIIGLNDRYIAVVELRPPPSQSSIKCYTLLTQIELNFIQNNTFVLATESEIHICEAVESTPPTLQRLHHTTEQLPRAWEAPLPIHHTPESSQVTLHNRDDVDVTVFKVVIFPHGQFMPEEIPTWQNRLHGIVTEKRQSSYLHGYWKTQFGAFWSVTYQ